jgi:VWFA-related protein
MQSMKTLEGKPQRTFMLFNLHVNTAAVTLCAAVLLSAQTQNPQTQSPQIFRAGTTVIPIDVRVLDRNGKAVTDLTAADFTILENGKPQTVDYFSATKLTPAEPDPSVSIRLNTVVSNPLTPQNRRLFLIILGRGRLQEPSKGVDATLRFVRQRLLPQDQVAIMAWNRATDFTTDHQQAAEVIERFKRDHEAIEALMLQYFSGLGGYYGNSAIPSYLQTMIDRVFGPQSGTSRQVLPNQTLGGAEADARRTLDAMKRSELEAFRAFGGSDVRMADGMFDPTLQMSFDDYIILNRQTMQDVGNLYAGIDYLRYIEGEKHIIFVTEQGFQMPRADHDRDLATMAADARVALNTVQTGGVATVGIGANINVVNGFQLSALRTISEISGGQVSVSQMGDKAFDRILASTDFGYLLGYTSGGEGPTGRARNIKVEVKRRSVTVSHRQAYIARSGEVRYDPRQSMATTRLVSAAAYSGGIDDLRFQSKLTDVREGTLRSVTAELTVDASRIVFARVGAEYLAAMNFTIICGDSHNKNIGEIWESRDIRIPASALEQVRRTGLPVTIKVPVRIPPSFVKIMIYDYGSDLLGSVTKTMR